MIRLLLLLIVLLVAASVCLGQYSRTVRDLTLEPSKLFQTRSDSDIKDLPVRRATEAVQFGTMLSRLAFQTGVAIGVEIDVGKPGWNDYKFDPELVLWLAPNNDWVLMVDGAKVYEDSRDDFRIRTGSSRFEDVLDDVVSQMKDYQWRITDGVINITPKNQTSKIVTEFLETRIKKLTIPAGTGNKGLFVRLRDAEELKNFKVFTSFRIRVGENKLILKEEVEFNDLTVREILNRLARINMCGWYVTSDPDDPKGKIHVAV